MISSLQRIFVFLEPKRISFLVQGFLSIRTGDQFKEREQETYFLLAVFDWLKHIGIEDAEQERIVREFRSGLVRFVSSPEDEEKEGHCLSIFDQRYVGYLQHASMLLDLHSGEMVEQMNQPAVTIIICNLHELMNRLQNRIKEVGVKHV